MSKHWHEWRGLGKPAGWSHLHRIVGKYLGGRLEVFRHRYAGSALANRADGMKVDWTSLNFDLDRATPEISEVQNLLDLIAEREGEIPCRP